jgi:hypothetical protein
MTIELRARQAGSDLRDWDPDLPDTPGTELVGRARRRRRVARGVAGAVAVGAAAFVIGLPQLTSQGDDVELGPGGPGATTRSTADPAEGSGTTAETPASTASTDPDASAAPGATAPEAPDPTASTVPARSTSCSRPLASGGSYVVTLPDGWYANEAVPGTDLIPPVAACTLFGPQPIEFRDYEELDGWATNAEVSLYASPEPGVVGYATWEDYLAAEEARVAPPEAQSERISSERRTVAAQPALREEFVENGLRWVRWNVLLGNTVVLATVGEESVTGTPYAEQVAALDAIVTTLRVDG